MAVLMTPPYLQFFDANGAPLAGGFVYTYIANTNTPKATYTDATEAVQLSNPIVLDSAGRCIPFISGSYDFKVTDALGNQIEYTPNVTAYNTTASAAASYFQSFSGNGTTTAFTLSRDLGTDPNAVMVFVDNGTPNQILNGTFDTDTIWTKGAGWTIGAGIATATGAISTDLSQTFAIPILPNNAYVVTYTITRTAGTITPNVGGQIGTARSAAGTYTEVISAGATQTFAFNTAGFTGTVDVVSINTVESKGRDVLNPSQYTLTSGGTPAITFAAAPGTGVNNILVFAPSTLVAAASASAAQALAYSNAAGTSAASAAASAITAANQAASFVGTSTTSVLIGTGSKSFTTQTAKNFVAGEFVTIASQANSANYMYGQITSYTTGTGALVVTITATGGSGTFTDWNIALSGQQGLSGGPVSNGTYGRIIVSGGGTVWNFLNFPYLVAVSDEASPLTTGTAKITFRMPMTMTSLNAGVNGIHLGVTTAPTGAALIVDVKKNGTTIFSTKPQIDAGSTTSVGSATPPVLTAATSFAIDDVITIDITQIGSTIAGAGLKVAFIGTV